MNSRILDTTLRATVFVPLLGLLLISGDNSTHAVAADTPQANAKKKLVLNTRKQVETSPESGRYHAVQATAQWDPKQTAVVICDMWDKHWCPDATSRVAEMAPRMNEVVSAARKQGVLIIHCPSNTLDYYAGTPQRKLAQQAPKVETKIPLENWCHLNPDDEAALPIDDSDNGCDTPDAPKPYHAWKKQIDAITIAPGDAITDSAEAYYLMKQRGITNVIVMGVHTNMCVLGRPFSIRQMVYQGQNVVLMRDMTDTMYNPASSPFVSHFTGTDLVVNHIEKFWCPTITSADFLGGKPFRFQHDKRPHLVIVSAEGEYDTKTTLPKFALENLGHDFRVSYVFADDNDRNNIPGLEVLDEADVALFSIRRRVLPAKQMAAIRRYVESGKPLVGIRTASHAFALRNEKPPAGFVDWPQFDQEVLGGNYHNHHSSKGPKTTVWIEPKAAKHEILRGVDSQEFAVHSTLYMTEPLADTTHLLMWGRVGDVKPHEPVAWTNTNRFGGKVFYTSLGHRQDFEIPAFRQLLKNGITWAAGLPMPKQENK